MTDIYTLNSSPVEKTRRSVANFVEPIYMKEISMKLISHLGSKIWNGLDKNIIKTSTSTNSFKYALKNKSYKTKFIYIYIYIMTFLL